LQVAPPYIRQDPIAEFSLISSYSLSTCLSKPKIIMASDVLCSVCRSLEFRSLVHHSSAAIPRVAQPDNDCQESSIRLSGGASLGSVAEVSDRADTMQCALCRMITGAAIAYEARVSDICEAMSIPFCKVGTKLHIARIVVFLVTEDSEQLVKSDASLENISKKYNEAKIILELKPCPKDVPSVDDAQEDWINSCYDWMRNNSTGLSQTLDLDIVSGRLMGQEANPKLMKAWIQRCHSEHRDQSVHDNAEWGVDLTDAKYIFVVDVVDACVASISPTKTRYVALSYCWGTSNTLLHTTENSNLLQTPGSLDSQNVPTTIRDAMNLLVSLDERYLWVDCLCIIQNDQVHSQEQVCRMDSIYSRAFFTIIAANGSDANSGLPGVRPGTRQINQTVLHLEDMSLISMVDERKHGGVKNSPWATRAWTLQEMVLSRRLLIFTNQQVYWHCPTATWMEEMRLEYRQSHMSNAAQNWLRYSNKSRGTFMPIFRRLTSHDTFVQTMLNRGDKFGVYADLVDSFVRRKISFRSDTLKAFIGHYASFVQIILLERKEICTNMAFDYLVSSPSE
jgi:hypothetical protein